MYVAKLPQSSDISDRRALSAGDDLGHSRVMHASLFGNLAQ
jgi:hypothetical protein